MYMDTHCGLPTCKLTHTCHVQTNYMADNVMVTLQKVMQAMHSQLKIANQMINSNYLEPETPLQDEDWDYNALESDALLG
jgi:hypothetical protein